MTIRVHVTHEIGVQSPLAPPKNKTTILGSCFGACHAKGILSLYKIRAIPMKKRKKITIGILTLAIGYGLFCLGYVLNEKTTAQPISPTPQHVFTAQELLTEANRLRAEKGVEPLTLDENLNKSAQWKAQDMADYDYFGHERDGYHGYQKIREYTTSCMGASENIETQDIGVQDSPFAWWVTSTPHYTAILNPKYDTTGFGVVNDNGRLLYVQHFCDLK